MGKYLVTSALPYINGVKHLGNLIGSMLPADVYSRHLRQQGEEVLFICGTDEHGTPAEIAALEENITVEEYCDKMHIIQKELYKKFNLSFDFFGRTSSKANKETTQEIYLALRENGYILEKEIIQVYSNKDNRFLPDRYIIGSCPYCGYHEARGDQCDGCNKLLDPVELLNPYSAITKSKDLEFKKSKHLFINLPKLENMVASWALKHKDWPPGTIGIAKKWLQEGLKERCISRDLKWGIQIPTVGYEDKVFYVWFDAPMAYISITKEWAISINKKDCWKEWWSREADVEYTQFMAKDNVPFHVIFWPAMLMGAKKDIRLVDYIKGFNWLTFEGAKFSTSSRRGIFIDDAINLYPADYWRYYLLSIAPESDDSSFSIDGFAATINKDLADILGNFVNRVLTLVNKYHGIIYNKMDREYKISGFLFDAIHGKLLELDAYHRAKQYRKTIQCVRTIWALGNEYITTKEPWKLIKVDEEKGAVVLMDCLYLIKIFCFISFPILPEISRRIYQSLMCPEDIALFSLADLMLSCRGAIKPQENNEALIIKKISEEDVFALKSRFGGI